MNNLSRLLVILPLFLLVACQYENEFSGTYNHQPARMRAFSKNTEKYCIELSLNGAAGSKQAFVRASAVFDSRDFSRPMSFQTKNEACGSNLPEYLSGSRSTKIHQTRPFSRREMMGGNYCQWVTYQEYLYTDEIQLEFRNRLSDQTVGVFHGTGRMESYVDFSRPVAYGPWMPCQYGGPFPGPRPFPGRAAPFPY